MHPPTMMNSGSSPKSKLLNKLMSKKSSKLIENVAIGANIVGNSNEVMLEHFKKSTNDMNNEMHKSEYGSTF